MKKELSMKKQAEEFVVNVNSELMNVRTSFIKIGYWLETAKNLQYYKQLKFNNFEDMAENLFGFKKSTAYGLCEVWDRFHDPFNKEIISPKYKEFSHSQLLEIKKVKFYMLNILDVIKPTDTVKDVKKLVSFWNKYTAKHSTTPKGESIQEIFEKYDLNEKQEALPLPNVHKELEKFEEVKEETAKIEEVTEEEFFQISGKNESFEDIEIQKESPIIITAQPCKAIVKGFKKLKNDNECLEFLRNCSLWPLWLEIPELDLKVYKIGLSDGSVILAYVSSWTSPTGKIHPIQSFRFFEKGEKVHFTSYFNEPNILVNILRKRELQVPDFKETNND